MKRLLDVIVAAAGLVASAPLMALIIPAVKRTPGPVIFAQERVGMHGRRFRLYKFRTMVNGAETMGGSVTAGNDRRVTSFGRMLRRTKLDELPQLVNVLKGDMSLVGPRPDVPEIVGRYTGPMREILSVRPGLTCLATLQFRDEEGLLARVRDPDRFYEETLVPLKVALGLEHVRRDSVFFDLKILLLTLWMLTPLGRLAPVKEHPLVGRLRGELFPDRGKRNG